MATQVLGTDGIEVYRNQDKRFLLAVRDASRDPVDLTGARITLTVRTTTNGTSLIVKSSTVVGEIDIAVPPTDGLADIFFVPADTVGLTAGSYVYDVWVVLADGTQQPVINPSPFNLLDPITTSP
jgi:hypothetical protein